MLVWHPICTDYSVMAHCDMARDDVYWNSTTHWMCLYWIRSAAALLCPSPLQSWYFTNYIHFYANLIRDGDGILSVLLYWHAALRPQCSFALIMLMAISIDFCCFLWVGQMFAGNYSSNLWERSFMLTSSGFDHTHTLAQSQLTPLSLWETTSKLHSAGICPTSIPALSDLCPI